MGRTRIGPAPGTAFHLVAAALSLVPLAGLWGLAALPVSWLLAFTLVSLPALPAAALLVCLVAATLRAVVLVLALLAAALLEVPGFPGHPAGSAVRSCLCGCPPSVESPRLSAAGVGFMARGMVCNR